MDISIIKKKLQYKVANQWRVSATCLCLGPFLRDTRMQPGDFAVFQSFLAKAGDLSEL